MNSKKSHLWFCKDCKKLYTLVNKKQHLATNKHLFNSLNKKIVQQLGKGILDDPIDNTNLPQPLQPSKYVAPKKPRIKRPRITPRTSIIRKKMPNEIKAKVKKLIEEITPYYEPEKISQFKKLLKFIPEVKITEKAKALKKNVKSYQVSIINSYDPAIQLSDTKFDIANLLKKII